VATGVVYRKLNPVGTTKVKAIETAKIEGITTNSVAAADNSGFRVDEEQTSLENITHYNNFTSSPPTRNQSRRKRRILRPTAGRFRSKVW